MYQCDLWPKLMLLLLEEYIKKKQIFIADRVYRSIDNLIYNKIKQKSPIG